MSNLLATGIAYKALKNDNSEVKTESSPKTFQESIFSKPLTWAIIAGAGIYFVSRFIKKDPLAIEKKDEKSLEQEGQKASYLDSAYKGYADSIYAARSANNLFGTDEDAIYSVFKRMNNDLDVAKLITAFGQRRLSFSLNSANLGGFLTDELDTTELGIVNSGLRSKGIKYQF